MLTCVRRENNGIEVYLNQKHDTAQAGRQACACFLKRKPQGRRGIQWNDTDSFVDIHSNARSEQQGFAVNADNNLI